MNNRFYKNNSSYISELADKAHELSLVEYTKITETEKADQVIFYDIFNQKFAELILNEAISTCGSQADRKNIRKLFGLPIESNVKYPSVDPTTSITSQYDREYNLPRGHK